MSIQKKKIAILPLLGLLVLVACNEDDSGNPCALETKSWSANSEIIVGEDPVVTAEQILQDSNCSTFVCLNHQGIPPYCSRMCDDYQNQCPDGFVCSVVTELGAHAGDRYCTFAKCEKDSDCLDVKKFKCSTFSSVTSDSSQTFKRCQLRTEE